MTWHALANLNNFLRDSLTQNSDTGCELSSSHNVHAHGHSCLFPPGLTGVGRNAKHVCVKGQEEFSGEDLEEILGGTPEDGLLCCMNLRVFPRGDYGFLPGLPDFGLFIICTEMSEVSFSTLPLKPRLFPPF